MNIYNNILNHYFSYKDQNWQVISHVKECEKKMASNPGIPRWGNELTTGSSYRECRNTKTGEVVRFGYEEFWNVTEVSYADEFKEIKCFYESHEPYSGWDMDCADLFRDLEWMIIDNDNYAKNTYQDLIKLSNDKGFKSFLSCVISSMKYNVSQIED